MSATIPELNPVSGLEIGALIEISQGGKSFSATIQETLEIIDITNLGSGAILYAGRVDNKFQLKSLIAGENITLVENPNDITISATGIRGITSINGNTTAAQIISSGNGIDVVNNENAHTLNVDDSVVRLAESQILTSKTIDAGNNSLANINEGSLTVREGAAGTVLTSRGINQTPTYQAIPNSGEDNTASNLAGVGLFAQKVGVDLEFKGLIAGNNVTLTPSATGVTISAIGGGVSGIISINGDTTAAQLIRAGTGINVIDGINGLHTIQIDNAVVTLDRNQILSNKTINAANNNLQNILETSLIVQAGAAGTVLTSNGVGDSPTYQAITTGEDNTGANLGAGAGVFAQKVGVVLQFKSLIAGDNITLTPSATGIIIASPSGGSGITSLNGNATPAQVVAAGAGLTIDNQGNTHIFGIDDTVVTMAGAQMLTNKTIDNLDNTLRNISETSLVVSIGAAGLVLTSNGIGVPPTYQAGAGVAGLISLNGDINPAQIIAVTAALTLVNNGATHTIGIGASIVTLVDAQRLSNKTLDGNDNNAFANIHEDSLTVQVGAAGTVLTSTGVGSSPTYQAASGGLNVNMTNLAAGNALPVNLNLNSFGLQGVFDIIFTSGDAIRVGDSTELEYQSFVSHNLYVNNIEMLRISSSGLSLVNHSILDVNNIGFENSTSIITSADKTIEIFADTIIFDGNNTLLSIDVTGINVFANSISSTFVPTDAAHLINKAYGDANYSGGGSSTLEALTDVTITNPVDNQVIKRVGDVWENSLVLDNMLGTNINAAKIGSGNITNAQFEFLAGATSDIQTQLNSKLQGNIAAIINSNWTFNRPTVFSNNNNKVFMSIDRDTNAATSIGEINYRARNTAGANIQYAEFTANILSGVNTAEQGEFFLSVQQDGALTRYLTLNGQLAQLTLGAAVEAGAFSISSTFVPTENKHLINKAYGDATYLGGSGEDNTASNLGAGAGLFAQKVGVDLEFKGLIAGANMTITQTATGITLAASGGGGGLATDLSNMTSPTVPTVDLDMNDNAITGLLSLTLAGDSSSIYYQGSPGSGRFHIATDVETYFQINNITAASFDLENSIPRLNMFSHNIDNVGSVIFGNDDAITTINNAMSITSGGAINMFIGNTARLLFANPTGFSFIAMNGGIINSIGILDFTIGTISKEDTGIQINHNGVPAAIFDTALNLPKLNMLNHDIDNVNQLRMRYGGYFLEFPTSMSISTETIFRFSIGGGGIMSINADGVNMSGRRIDSVRALTSINFMDISAVNTLDITCSTGTLDISAGTSIGFEVNNIATAIFDSVESVPRLNMLNHNIDNVVAINFEFGQIESIANATSNILRFSAEEGGTLNFVIGTTSAFSVNGTTVDWQNKSMDFVGAITRLGRIQYSQFILPSTPNITINLLSFNLKYEMSSDVTLSLTEILNGRNTKILFVAGDTERIITLQAAWKKSPNNNTITIPANQSAMLDFYCSGDDDAGVFLKVELFE